MYANINLGNISLPRLIFTLQYNYSLLQVDFIGDAANLLI